MAKREKIIVSLMALALLFGAYILLFDSKKNAPPSGITPGQLTAITTKVAEEMEKGGLSKAEAHILEKGIAQWPTDPFLGKPLSPSADTAKSDDGQAQASQFAYLGYMEAGNKRLAIINGMEYQVGEELETGGFIVRSIDQDKVLLEITGKQIIITVPFTGETIW